MTEGTKSCPACGETIHAQAILCRFCKKRLDAPPAAPPPAPAASPPRKSGFPVWVLVLLILGCGGVPFVAIVAAIAIPGLMQSQRASNERGAATTLRTIAAAEADFRANDRDGNGVSDFWTGDVSSLYYLKAQGHEIRLIDRLAANADAQPLGPTPRIARGGYWFAALKTDGAGEPYDRGKGRNPVHFAFCAYPAGRSSGRYTFLIGDGNAVFRKDMGGRGLDSWPTGEDERGWVRLD